MIEQILAQAQNSSEPGITIAIPAAALGGAAALLGKSVIGNFFGNGNKQAVSKELCEERHQNLNHILARIEEKLDKVLEEKK